MKYFWSGFSCKSHIVRYLQAILCGHGISYIFSSLTYDFAREGTKHELTTNITIAIELKKILVINELFGSMSVILKEKLSLKTAKFQIGESINELVQSL